MKNFISILVTIAVLFSFLTSCENSPKMTAAVAENLIEIRSSTYSPTELWSVGRTGSADTFKYTALYYLTSSQQYALASKMESMIKEDRKYSRFSSPLLTASMRSGNRVLYGIINCDGKEMFYPGEFDRYELAVGEVDSCIIAEKDGMYQVYSMEKEFISKSMTLPRCHIDRYSRAPRNYFFVRDGDGSLMSFISFDGKERFGPHEWIGIVSAGLVSWHDVDSCGIYDLKEKNTLSIANEKETNYFLKTTPRKKCYDFRRTKNKQFLEAGLMDSTGKKIISYNNDTLSLWISADTLARIENHILVTYIFQQNGSILRIPANDVNATYLTKDPEMPNNFIVIRNGSGVTNMGVYDIQRGAIVLPTLYYSIRYISDGFSCTEEKTSVIGKIFNREGVYISTTN